MNADRFGFERDGIGLFVGSDVAEEIYKETRKGGRQEVKEI
jgi:hypothetical protein